MLPLSYYLHLIDGSSVLDNSIILFFGVLSHALLDMLNIEPVPIFYIPVVNKIGKAKMYTWYTLFNAIINLILKYLFLNQIPLVKKFLLKMKVER